MKKVLIIYRDKKIRKEAWEKLSCIFGSRLSKTKSLITREGCEYYLVDLETDKNLERCRGISFNEVRLKTPIPSRRLEQVLNPALFLKAMP